MSHLGDYQIQNIREKGEKICQIFDWIEQYEEAAYLKFRLTNCYFHQLKS